MENRASESPARTIDSRDSTSASVETIVDRNKQFSVINKQAKTMANTTNATNNNNKNSLTNSQISMISSDQKDHSSHIYTSPDLVINSKENAGKRSSTALNSSINKNSTNIQKLKSVIEQHQQKQQQQHHQQKLQQEKKLNQSISKTSSSSIYNKKRSSFPIHIIFGIIQLILACSLTSLGGLLIVRGASLSSTACGLWSGGMAAIAGALGVINLRKARTGFLASSLICIATSTLALSLTGIGLVRDINRLEQEEPSNIQNVKAAISAGSGLIFALFLHFVASIMSVYHSAIKLCSRKPNEKMLENVISVNNASVISQQKVEEYIKSMTSGQNRDKILSPENCDKLMAMWMYTAKRGGVPPSMKAGAPSVPNSQHSNRPIVLVPATAGNGLTPMMPPPAYHSRRHAAPLMLPPGVVLPPGVLIPTIPPILSTAGSDSPYNYSKVYSSRRSSEISRRAALLHHQQQQRQQQQQQQRRTGKREASRRQRRKSESDAEDPGVFTYTGLDRAIADSFLERQEISHAGSNVDYSSSSSESGRDRRCPDVAM